MSKENPDRQSYTFFAYGHPNIKATHFKTLEFTKGSDLTERGDCIVGIKSDFDLNQLKKFSKKARLIISAINADGIEIISEFKFTVNPNFNSENEFVLRKSLFNSERTYGFNLNRGANRLDRALVELLKNPNQKVKVTILSGWA